MYWAVLVSIVFAAAMTAAGAVLAGDFEPRDPCDARAIAPFVHTLTLEEHLEVVDTLEALGGLEAKHAEKLRVLIHEARETKDLDAWITRHCGA